MVDNTPAPALDELVGKYILLAITRMDHEDNVIGQYEYHASTNMVMRHDAQPNWFSFYIL